MRKIFISEKVKGICEQYCQSLFAHKNGNFKKPDKLLSNLIHSLNKDDCILDNRDDYIYYVQNIIDNYDKILSLKPSEFERFKQEHFSMLSNVQLSEYVHDGRKNGDKFYEHIVAAMRYDAVQASEFPPFVRRLGIKSCAYCNSQYSISAISSEDGNDITTYEIDHYFPKSKYPFLCISFYNLIPSCGSCNRRKNDNDVEFCLYSENREDVSPFNFELKPESVAKYILDHNPDSIEIVFNSKYTSHKRFKVVEIYNEHKDVAEEIIWKHVVYNPAYLKSMKKQFGNTLNLDDDMMHRILFGTYNVSENEINAHRRPLSVFINDITKNLDDLYNESK